MRHPYTCSESLSRPLCFRALVSDLLIFANFKILPLRLPSAERNTTSPSTEKKEKMTTEYSPPQPGRPDKICKSNGNFLLGFPFLSVFCVFKSDLMWGGRRIWYPRWYFLRALALANFVSYRWQTTWNSLLSVTSARLYVQVVGGLIKNECVDVSEREGGQQGSSPCTRIELTLGLPLLLPENYRLHSPRTPCPATRSYCFESTVSEERTH